MKYQPGQLEFEEWFKKYWGGVPLTWCDDADEYKETAAQTAWETWRRFWPKKKPSDSKIWNVTVAARYRRGKLIEHFDHSLQSSMHPQMVEFADYAVMFGIVEDMQKEIDTLTEKNRELESQLDPDRNIRAKLDGGSDD